MQAQARSRGISGSQASSSAVHCSRGCRRPLSVRALLQQAEGVAVTWAQSVDDVRIRVPVAEEVHPHRLSLRLHGQPLLEGSLKDAGEITVDDCFWTMESDAAGKYIEVVLGKKSMGFNSWESLLVSDRVDLSITDRCFLEISIDGEPAGKIAVGLFGKAVPRTAANFKDLCSGSRGEGTLGKPLHYEGSIFHRIIPGFMVQGGDITNNDGTGGESIYGPDFEDENFKAKHDEAGLLAMANAGPNTNSSQFYILLAPTPHLDGKHVVFGRVLAGMDVVRRMENMGTPGGSTMKKVAITSSGLLANEQAVQDIMDSNKMAQLNAATA